MAKQALCFVFSKSVRNDVCRQPLLFVVHKNMFAMDSGRVRILDVPITAFGRNATYTDTFYRSIPWASIHFLHY